MSGHLAAIPLWAAVVISLLVALGSGLTLLGTIGLVRLASFYDRIHAPTLGTSWGTFGIMLGSALMFSITGERVILHELVIGVLIMVTMPVTLMILGRAALFRGDQSRLVQSGKRLSLQAALPDADPAEVPAQETG